MYIYIYVYHVSKYIYRSYTVVSHDLLIVGEFQVDRVSKDFDQLLSDFYPCFCSDDDPQTDRPTVDQPPPGSEFARPESSRSAGGQGRSGVSCKDCWQCDRSTHHTNAKGFLQSYMELHGYSRLI